MSASSASSSGGVRCNPSSTSQVVFGSMSSEEELSVGPMSMDNLLSEGGGAGARSSPLFSSATGSSSLHLNNTSSSGLLHSNTSPSSAGLLHSSSHNLRSNTSSASLSSSALSGGVKVKRTRQRVDAGEPRNSYASIANFSSTRAGYQLIRSGRNSSFFSHQPYLNQNSNSNEGTFNPTQSQSFNGNSPPNFKLLQQLSSGNISPKSLSNHGQSINNDSNNNLGQFKSSNFLGRDKDSVQNMILLDEAVMQMCASAAAGASIPTMNGSSTARNPSSGLNRSGQQSDEEMDDSEAASHLLRDILQTGVGSVRDKQQLEQALAGLTKDGHQLPTGGVGAGPASSLNNNNSTNLSSDEEGDDEERDELMEGGEEEEDRVKEEEEEEDPNEDEGEEDEESRSSSLGASNPSRKTRGRPKFASGSKQPVTEAETSEGINGSSELLNKESEGERRRTRSQSKNTSSSIASGRSSSLVSSGSRASPSSDLEHSNAGEGTGIDRRGESIEGGEESNGKSTTGIKDNNSIQVIDGSEDLTTEGASKEESVKAVDSSKLGSRLEKLVSNMSQATNGNNGSSSQTNNNDSVTNDGQTNSAPSVPVNGCKKRKLYQPQQSSKLTSATDEEEDDEELLLSNDEEEAADDLSGSGASFPSRSFPSQSHLLPSSPKRPKQQLKDQQQYLELIKSHVMMNQSGSEDERDGRSPVSDREMSSPSQVRPSSSSPPLNFHEIKQQALNKVTAAILNQRCTLNGGNNAEWVTALKTELVANVAHAIETTFSDFGRNNPALKRRSLLTSDREELLQIPKQQSQQGAKDISLLTQMLESKTSPSHHGHHLHRHHRTRGATLLGKAPSVRDDRSSKNSLRRTPMNGSHSFVNVNPFDRDGHPKFPAPFPAFPSPSSGFKNPFPFFPHGVPNPVGAALPPMPPSLAQHFTSIANAIQRQRAEQQQQSSVANLSRAMEQSSQREHREREHREREHRERDESPSNRSTNNSSTGPVDTQSEALSLVVSPKRKRSSKVSVKLGIIN